MTCNDSDIQLQKATTLSGIVWSSMVMIGSSLGGLSSSQEVGIFRASFGLHTLSITKIVCHTRQARLNGKTIQHFFLTPLLAASSSPRRRYGVDSAPPRLSPPMFCGAIFRTYRAKVISSIDATKLFVLLPLESNCVVDNSFVGSGTL